MAVRALLQDFVPPQQLLKASTTLFQDEKAELTFSDSETLSLFFPALFLARWISMFSSHYQILNDNLEAVNGLSAFKASKTLQTMLRGYMLPIST